jgi:DNA-directed RNA polymerase subunit M/transcription elongation factor TFIIS
MYIPKRYGESHVDTCPFCGRQAINKNPQGVPVCKDHKDKKLPEMKCMCGSYLMMQEGKFGIYFNCIKCGNMSLKKVLEINPNILHAEKIKDKTERPGATKQQSDTVKVARTEIIKKQQPREQTVRSDDPRYFRY